MLAPLAYTLAGTLGASLGWGIMEPLFHEGGCTGRIGAANAFFFPVVMGAVGGAIMAADSWPPWKDREKHGLAWAVLGVAIALGFLFQATSHALFAWLSPSGASPVHPFHHGGAMVGLGARAVAWGFNASVIGIAVGIVTGNWGTALPLTMGGVLGGLMAGLLFDPLQFLIYGGSSHSAWLSRLCGFLLTGGMAGFVSSITSDCATTGTIRVQSGSLSGDRVAVDIRQCFIGSSPRCQIIVADSATAHCARAVIFKSGFRFRLETLGRDGVQVNGRTVVETRLRHGDRIRVGDTEMIFFCPGPTLLSPQEGRP